MGSTTVRVNVEVRAKLQRMAAGYCEPMQDILAKAVEAYRRQRMMELANEQYAALRADPEVWAEILAERAVWDVTLMDGLEDEPPYPVGPDGKPLPRARCYDVDKSASAAGARRGLAWRAVPRPWL